MRMHHIPEIRGYGGDEEKSKEYSQQSREQKVAQGNLGVFFKVDHGLKL